MTTPIDDEPGPFRADDYGRLLAAHARLEKSVNARFDALTLQIQDLAKREQQREGASKVWRWAGSLAAAVALSLGSAALTLAQTAAVDHERVNTLTSDLAEFHRDEDVEEALEAERWERMGREFGEARTTIDTTKAVLERVERQLERLEARTTTPRR